MTASKILILKGTVHKPILTENTTVITFEELKEWIREGNFFKHIFSYQTVSLLTSNIEFISKPFLTTILILSLSRGLCQIEDEQGYCQRITICKVVKLLGQLLRDFRKVPAVLQQIEREVEQLLLDEQNSQLAINRPDLSAHPVYLRTDLCFGIRSGGSIGHMAGVLNNFDNFINKPLFITTDVIPTVRNDIEIYQISPPNLYFDFNEIPTLFFNQVFEQASQNILRNKPISFIYQRYSINNYSGVKLSKFYDVPLVLEYNGSEIWVGRNWGKPWKYESLATRIELLNLKAADVVVVVSQPLKDELMARHIEADKILVNPNGVDPERYSSSVDGSGVRCQYNLVGKTVIGFIGTFGKWHGAEVLAEAFGQLLQELPVLRDEVRLFLIGDGLTMPLVKEQLTKFDVMDACILTGMIPQEEGPAYLAACDILASPHVPNPDGTPFFGSPTKLFEYMAMGKGIVASDLEQIGEVLTHDQTAWMVKPGDAQSLKLGLKVLIDDQQRRERLGEAARREVVSKYTWREHTRKIIDKLKERWG